MNLRADIPVKGYILKHFANNFGTPAKISRESLEGKILLAMIDDDRTELDYQFSSSAYPFTLTVELSEDIYLRKGCFLTKSNTIAFNNAIEDIIKAQLIQYVEIYMEAVGAKQTTAIQKFMEKFGYDEESFNFDTIKKAFYRHRKRQWDNSQKVKNSL